MGRMEMEKIGGGGGMGIGMGMGVMLGVGRGGGIVIGKGWKGDRGDFCLFVGCLRRMRIWLRIGS